MRTRSAGRSAFFSHGRGRARTLVGAVKTRSFKNDAAAAVDNPAHFAAALGTNGDRVVAHALKNFKTMRAFFTFIFIRWHSYLSISISVPKKSLLVQLEQIVR